MFYTGKKIFQKANGLTSSLKSKPQSDPLRKSEVELLIVRKNSKVYANVK